MPVNLKIKVTKEVLKESAMCSMVELHSDKIIPYKYCSLSEQNWFYQQGGTVDVTANCAIAVAVRGIFPTARVGQEKISVPNKNSSINHTISLPGKAQVFIEKFDRCPSPEQRMLMDEIEFEVEVPDELINDLDISDIKEYLKESKTLELV